MTNPRPFLTAKWTDLLLLNFEVAPAALAPYVPLGTELDLFDGRAYLSIVGFRFGDTRLFGLPIPGHRAFEEINLRFYVTHAAHDGLRRGVVFVRELVPRRAVTAVARWLYGENYATVPMSHCIHRAAAEFAPGDRLEYCWRSRPGHPPRWNRLAARVLHRPARPEAGSLSEFIVEHYWGYVGGMRRATGEYWVEHRPWLVADVADVEWVCDLAANYPRPLIRYLENEPSSALIADGSAVAVYPRRAIRVAPAAEPAIGVGR